MALFKCKMCGGTLEVGNESVAVCEYCGTQQTLPKLDDEKKTNLYDRANHFRRNNEYDKAKGIYEKILNEDNTDAEAYWSIVLCHYGIEYVEDPMTHKRVPTVNRAQFTSIFDDANYKAALEYADTLQKGIYEEEAKTINEIQKGILAISQQEEPFDVFICYKETDNAGRRTPDSVLANDLYHQLTQEGFKVFFARITLEDKLGSAYEPYIFAALNSAKVMVVLGTKPEHYNAVWVKNEWSRYLALIRNGEQKMLIPAYKDMDPYDLPEEFSHLQAQDMSKLGFMQDLIRGIKKIIGKNESQSTRVVETVVAGTAGIGNMDALLKRAFMFLEDGDWSKADEFCEQVLNINPENAMAYVGKLMATLHLQQQTDLEKQSKPFDNDGNYKKAVRFADNELKAELQGYIESIKYRNCDLIYDRAVNMMSSAKTEKAYNDAAKEFEKIKEHKDSLELITKCHELSHEMHIKQLIIWANRLLDSVLTEKDFDGIVEQICGAEIVPEIIKLVDDARVEYADRFSVALSLWNDYLAQKSVADKCEVELSTVKDICRKCEQEIQKLDNQLVSQLSWEKELRFLNDDLKTENNTVVNLEAQLVTKRKELNDLGFFSLGAKKEVSKAIDTLEQNIAKQNNKIDAIQQKINNLKKNIENLASKEAINQEMCSLRRTIELHENDDVVRDAKEASQQLHEVVSKVTVQRHLAALIGSNDEALFKSVVSDPNMLDALRYDSKLRDLVQSSVYFCQLPSYVTSQFKRKKGNELDPEAIYFQACQALENPLNASDIEWAKEQFQSIYFYKNARSLIVECDRKLADYDLYSQ